MRMHHTHPSVSTEKPLPEVPESVSNDEDGSPLEARRERENPDGVRVITAATGTAPQMRGDREMPAASSDTSR